MAAEGAARTSQVFDEVYFAIIPSDDLSPAEADKLSQNLTSHGGTKLEFDSQKLHQITHLISTHTDFPAYYDAIEGFIHVVRPSWVDSSLQKGKASNPRQFSPDAQYFFADVVLCCADDIPEGDKEAIIGGVHAMGGQYSPKMTKLVTHLVALTKKSQKCQTAFQKSLKCTIVLPHWFDACLRLGKKISPEPYVIPREGQPLLFTQRTSDPVKHSEPKIDLSQPSSNPFTPPASPPGSPSTQRQALNVLRNKHVMLHDDLGLSDHLLSSIKDIITQGGGEVVEEAFEANMLICQYRDTKEFVDASRAGKDVGNITWLYKLISRNRWTDPTSRLLYYPYPKGGIPGFDGFSVSVSNYQGDTRIWLESLVLALGGTFNKNMSQETTCLITAHTESDKCDAAREWNIEMVNHLWLEESYARCEMQPMSRSRYTTWPERTNLGEVVGQTPIDRDAIAEHCWPKRAESEQAVAGMMEDEDEEVYAGDDDQIEIASDDEPPANAATTPAASSAKKKERQHRTPLQQLQAPTITPASRGAKSRALSKLHDMAPDIAQFEKESKRVGGVIYGGRRVTDTDRIASGSGNKASSRKRSISETGTTPEAQAETIDGRFSKKTKTDKPTQSTIRIAASGIGDTETYQTKLKGMGCKFVDDTVNKQIDVLVLSKMVRTVKVLCAMPKAPMIVNKGWLDAMVKKCRQLPPEDYLFNDPETEQRSNLSLVKSEANARKNMLKGGMLKGWTVLSTENITGGFETLRDVVVANGGRYLLFKGRETKIPAASATQKNPKVIDLVDDDSDVIMDDKSDQHDVGDESGKPTLYLVSVESDKALWKKFESMATEKGYQPCIARTDWLWRITMSQDAREWQDEWCCTE